MPIKTSHGTASETTAAGRAETGYQFQELPIGEIEVNDLTLGMVISGPREQRPPGSATSLVNARSRFDYVGRRPGTGEVLATKPDSFPILKLITSFFPNDQTWLTRITRDGIYAASSTGVGYVAFTGPSYVRDRRISVTQYLDWVFFAHPDFKVQRIDFGTQTYDEMDEAPKAQFIVAFADRIVAANIRDPSLGQQGTKIQWSANAQPTIWDPQVNASAGEAWLDSAPADSGDEITGLHVVGNTLVILRERSIWLGERSGLGAEAPFRFRPFVSNIGCNLPYSSVNVPGGLIWADARTRNIYQWAIGGPPQQIGTNITRDLLTDLEESEWTEATWDPFEDEYHLGLAVTGNRVEKLPEDPDEPYINRVWVLARSKNSWSYDVGPVVSTLGVNTGLIAGLTIDQLLGVINAQVPVPADPTKPNPDGWIDDWGEAGDLTPTIMKGTVTGETIVQSFGYPFDWDGFNFEYEFISQDFGKTSKRRTLKELMVRCVTPFGGKFYIDYNTNQYIDWKAIKTIDLPAGIVEQNAGSQHKQITGPSLYFRIRSQAQQFQMTELWLRILEKGRVFSK